MAFLNEDDRVRIGAAIADAERRTSGELVTVIAPMADDYLYIPALWAALCALLLPGILLLAGGVVSLEEMYLYQVGLFVAMAVIFRWPPLLIRLIPRGVRMKESSNIYT